MSIRSLLVLFALSASFLCVRCFRREYLDTEDVSAPPIHPSMAPGSPWPMPKSYQTSPKFQFIDELNFRFEATEHTCQILDHAFTRYFKIIFDAHPAPLKFRNVNEDKLHTLDVVLENPCEKYPTLESDESYSLQIDDSSAQLKAKSIWGILWGLETFSQLVHRIDEKFAVNHTMIIDAPRFPWRGVLLDSSRHFLPVPTIYRTLDAMAYNKMNVFHWHIVDENAFPYESYTFPNLSLKGAYRPYTHVYSQQDVANIIEYARMRGIRVMAEFDSPAHSLAMGEGQPGLLTKCLKGPPYGPFDPSKNSTYEFVEKLFTEVAQVFPESYIHLGGDEVDTDCWKSNPNITEFMKKIGIAEDYGKLEAYYFNKLLAIVKKLNKYQVLWEEAFFSGFELQPNTIIQAWIENDVVDSITKAGHKALVSAGWYLNYVGYAEIWPGYYQVDPHKFAPTPEQKALVLGGEACMWGEYVDATNIHSRLWPSASAVAERLWSPANVMSVEAARPRMQEHRCRMVKRGIPAGPPSGPGFCEIEMVL